VLPLQHRMNPFNPSLIRKKKGMSESSRSQPGFDECSLASADAEPSASLKPARVIVCGGRDFHDYYRVAMVLDRLRDIRPFAMVFHGNARGADACADRWCRERGVGVFPVPAQWAKHGKAAGPKRNQAMLGQGIDLVVAFPRANGEIGAGTADMIRRARKAGVPVTVARRQSTRRLPEQRGPTDAQLGPGGEG
jgi:hypothetical protein